MNHHKQDSERTEVASDHELKNAGILQGIFKSATSGPLKMFQDIALTVSKSERLDMMISRYNSTFGKLRDLFGWDSKTKREMRVRACNEFPRAIVEAGSPIPIQYLSLSGFGEMNGVRCALISTTIDIGMLKLSAKRLSADRSRKYSAIWKHSNPYLYARASEHVCECLRRPLPLAEISAIVSSESSGKVVVIFGEQHVPTKLPSIHLNMGVDREQFVAFLISLFCRCPLGWLIEDQNLRKIDSTLHPLTASLLCAQFDPGIKWTGTSLDGSARMLQLESGIRQVLQRPGIALHKQVSASLWRLLGALVPQEGEPVSVWGSTRENAIGIGILLPKLPSTLFFALLQSGLSPAVRRIVAITQTAAPVDTARLISGLLSGCEHASRKSTPSSLILNAFFSLERLLKSGNEPFGVEPFNQRRDGSDEADPELFSITAFVAELEAGRIPDEYTIDSLRRHFIDRKTDDEPSNPMIIRIGKMLLTWILVALVRWLLRPAEIEYCPPPNGDTWERDSNVILRQKQIQRKANGIAKNLEKKQSTEILVDVIKRAIVFGFTRKTHDLQPRAGAHFAKLVALISDALMILVKRSAHGMVLEQRLWEEISSGCGLTICCNLDSIFRYPCADAYEAPNWLRQCAADPEDLVEIDLTPICENLRVSKRIRRQVESISDICDCAAAEGLPLFGLSELCRIRWDDDIALLTRLSSETFVRELRPPTQINQSELTNWWLRIFRVNNDDDLRSQKRCLALLFDEDPEGAVIAMLNVAAADQAAIGSGTGKQKPAVHISQSEILLSFERSTKRDESNCDRQNYNNIKSNESDDEGSTGNVNSETLEAEERLVLFIQECGRKEVQDLRHAEEEPQKSHLIEMKRILRKHFDAFGRTEFSALVKEAVSEMNSADRQAVVDFIWECIDEKPQA